MTNKQQFKEALKEIGYELGCYDNNLEKLTKKAMKEVLEEIEFGYHIYFTMRRIDYVIEVYQVGNETDLYLKTVKEYEAQYN